MNQIEAGSPARRHDKYERLITLTRENPAIPTAVAHPCDESSLRGAVEAAEAGIIVPILVGPADKIRAVAEKAGLKSGRNDGAPQRAAQTVGDYFAGATFAIMPSSGL